MAHRGTKIEFDYTLENAGVEVDVHVKATVYPGHAGSRDEPPEGPEVEFNHLACDGAEFDLLDNALGVATEGKLYDVAIEKAEDEWGAEMDDYDDPADDYDPAD